jgi:hypothetical protein
MMTAKPISVKISDKKRKSILVIIGTVVSPSVVAAAGIGFATTLASCDSTTDLYKQTLCRGKALDFAQKGVIPDVGGFNGAIYECTHMKLLTQYIER